METFNIFMTGTPETSLVPSHIRKQEGDSTAPGRSLPQIQPFCTLICASDSPKLLVMCFYSWNAIWGIVFSNTIPLGPDGRA